MKSLFQYKGWVHVPDSENQGNFKIKGVIEVEYNDSNELDDKILNHLRKKYNSTIHDLKISKVDSI